MQHAQGLTGAQSIQRNFELAGDSDGRGDGLGDGKELQNELVPGLDGMSFAKDRRPRTRDRQRTQSSRVIFRTKKYLVPSLISTASTAVTRKNQLTTLTAAVAPLTWRPMVVHQNPRCGMYQQRDGCREEAYVCRTEEKKSDDDEQLTSCTVSSAVSGLPPCACHGGARARRSNLVAVDESRPRSICRVIFLFWSVRRGIVWYCW